MASLTEITNYVQMADDIGSSGQPSREQFSAIAAAGYQVVVNLALPSSDHAIAEEGSIVTGLGMRFVHIPVDFAAPTARDLKQFIGVMEAFRGSKIWVHCVVNARVSAFLYHYLAKVRGLPEAKCRSPVLKKWAPQMDDVWKTFLSLDEAAIEAA
ncbi:MAG TPA: protein tyrosine phosphatase family protein [Pseudomonadales bacterium]